MCLKNKTIKTAMKRKKGVEDIESINFRDNLDKRKSSQHELDEEKGEMDPEEIVVSDH